MGPSIKYVTLFLRIFDPSPLSQTVTVCSGCVMVTAYDSESGRPGSNPEWGLIYYEAPITAQGLPEPSFLILHSSGVVHWVPEQLIIKAVTGHAS